MDGKYKVWMTQGQGHGEFPDVECDALDEALQEAASMFGEGSVGIELPNGSWHKFSEEWNMPTRITLLRLRKDGLNPKQKWLMGKWQEVDVRPKTLIRWLQTGAHTFQDIWLTLTTDRIEERQAQKLLFDSLTWGLFDIFEFPTGIMPTDEHIDWIMNRQKDQR